MSRGPHAGRPLARAGMPLDEARLAMVLLHGRGSSAADILGLFEHLAIDDVAALAPEAAGHSWWPQSFLAPLAANEPFLSSALAVVGDLVGSLEARGVARERIVVCGFSQGGCLALEAAARLGPFRLVAGLSAALVGTAETDAPPSPALYGHRPKRFDYASRFDGAPVLLACHERDPHIPLARVRESAAVFEGLGASVATLVAPGPGHAPTEEAVRAVRRALAG